MQSQTKKKKKKLRLFGPRETVADPSVALRIATLRIRRYFILEGGAERGREGGSG